MKVQSMFSEIEEQRNIALARCAQMAGLIGELQDKVKELENKLKPQPDESPAGGQNVKPLQPKK